MASTIGTISAATPIDAHKPHCSSASLLLLCAGAVLPLANARISLARFRTRDLAQRNQDAKGRGLPLDHSALQDMQSAQDIAWIVPRVARRMPFRSDCLVQAMAAQVLLLDRGIFSEIVIGVEGGPDKPFASHAWLVCADLVVVGGDIAQFNPILGDT
ncbi:MAG: lasso peptide biosynthesis B2 protein [Alteraurantiacibacter sp.]